MRPTFNRWFGAKYGKTSFSEATGTYKSGAYVDFRRFILSPIGRAINQETGDHNPVIGAAMNIAQGYMDYMTNISYYYNMLPKHEQQGVKRTLAQIAGIALFTSIIYAAYAGMGGDKEKDKYNNGVMANVIYQLSSIQSELIETTVIGWGSFYARSKKNIVPAERSITDLGGFFYYGILYPFRDDDQNLYQTGIYKGESKALVRLKKLTPGLRQIQTQQHLGNTISYYNMYNPVYNILGINGKTGDVKPPESMTE